MKTLTVDLGERSYPIYIGAGLLSQTDLLRRHIPGKQVLLVSNETIAPLYLPQIKAALADFRQEAVILPDGESHKTLDVLNRIYDALLENRFDRACTLIAVGGGVVGDMTGFAAATYQRGVHFIQIPTTLLAQVDSSVGGKTGVNHPRGKNMIGAFYQPRCVLADMDTLGTLPDRELSAGLAEVIKYGLLGDAVFLQWLEVNIKKLTDRSVDALSYAVERSCQIKADIVATDEREQGVRALLNLGHTFGHAIETGTGYGTWLHGEAVAVGMIMAADLSARLGWLDDTQVARVIKLVRQANLPMHPPTEFDHEDWLRLMAVDKKVQEGRMRFILLKSLGEAVIAKAIDLDLLKATFDAFRTARAI